MVIVVLVGALYSGFFGERDLAEAGSQARGSRLAMRGMVRAKPPRGGVGLLARGSESGERRFVTVSQVGSRIAAEQARALLSTEGIPAIVKCEDTGVLGPGAGSGTRSVIPARLLVRKRDQERAQELLKVLLQPGESAPPDET